CLWSLLYVLRSVTGWYIPHQQVTRRGACHSVFWGVSRCARGHPRLPPLHPFPGAGDGLPALLSSPGTECRHGTVVGSRHRPACVPDRGDRDLLVLAATPARTDPPGPQAAQ